MTRSPQGLSTARRSNFIFKALDNIAESADDFLYFQRESSIVFDVFFENAIRRLDTGAS